MKNGTNGHRNGHTSTPPLPAVRLLTRNQALAQAELDNYDTAIGELDAALADVAAARGLLAAALRRAVVAQERCELLRLAVRLQLGAEAR